MTSKVEDLADKVRRLSPSQKLEMAAGLVDKGLPDTAELVAEMAINELRALRLFGKSKR